MIWTAIREIHAEMFRVKVTGAERNIGIWKLATGVTAVAGAVGFYWKIPDDVTEWLDYRFYDAKTAKTAFETWQAGSHLGLRLLIVALFFLLFYVIAFSVCAVKRLDHRKQYARTFGVRFTTIRREHDVLNLAGDCLTTSTESFAVDELQLAYIERRLQSPPGSTRTAPAFSVEGLPPGSTETHSYLDIGPLRTYSINFTPPLHQTEQLVTVKTSETISRGIFMSQASTPIHGIFKSKVESISLLVMEPIDELELSVAFPPGYAVGGSSQMRVCYGRTPTVHDKEEQRLKENGAIKPESTGARQTLRFRVTSPIVGLQYYLYWEPPP